MFVWGGALAVTSSGLSIVTILARRRASVSNQDVAIRRSILSYAVFLSQLSNERKHPIDETEDGKWACGGTKKVNLSGGTSLTDVYSVYRMSGEVGVEGHWHKIPTLLLVEGDYIALQVGDTAPAAVELLDLSFINEKHDPHQSWCSGVKSKSIKTIAAGERVQHRPHKSHLPRGKIAVAPDSKDLLFLCNDMRIYVLRETPLRPLLQCGDNVTAKRKSPRIHQQAGAIRSTLCVASAACFILASSVLLGRNPHILSTLSTGESLISISVLLLSAMGALPTTNVLVLFVLEIMGTARIMQRVHPYSADLHRNHEEREDSFLFVRYCVATLHSRLFRQNMSFSPDCKTASSSGFLSKYLFFLNTCSLSPVPPANAHLLENLGVATAIALIDDEIACDPISTPQQLLIPSGHGLKLLDLCPALSDHVKHNHIDDSSHHPTTRKPGPYAGSSIYSDSESDDDRHRGDAKTSSARKTFQKIRHTVIAQGYKRKGSGVTNIDKAHATACRNCHYQGDGNAVQFEDPTWWQHLPSLKCIGLACLLVDGKEDEEEGVEVEGHPVTTPPPIYDHCEDQEPTNKLNIKANRPPSPTSKHPTSKEVTDAAEKSLIQNICQHRKRCQLQSLAQCIGFNTDRINGDTAPFREKKRLHIVSMPLLLDRMTIDTHALGLEESRSWGLLRSHSTSVIVRDGRTKAYQLFTAGDSRVVVGLCTDAWQGENSTIAPLSAFDRKSILETSDNWRLADLDVSVFSYAPVPYTLEKRISGSNGSKGFLVDNLSEKDPTNPTANHKISVPSGDWSFTSHQIFLGMLGSLVSPRKEIEPIIKLCTAAGVRFVYFSPRNMRRTKELASQMGIDVAWNCAISLRDLDKGEEDPHRMTSTYADWDVNAKLPHGVENVKIHLKEVDNVPLLVSLYTDVTERSTKEMVNVFQEYGDTVITLGLSHRSRHEPTFTAADIAIGIDDLNHEPLLSPKKHSHSDNVFDISTESLLAPEVQFVSSMSSHSCIFNLKGISSVARIPEIICHGRTALEAASSASIFVVNGSLSLSALALMCPFSVCTSIPFVPVFGAVLYLQVLIPLLGLSMAMTESDAESMTRVPPKNDESVIFSRGEGKRLYLCLMLRSVPPAVFSQILYLIAFGQIAWEMDRPFLESHCPLTAESGRSGTVWVSVIRCAALRDYGGAAKAAAARLMIAEMALCVIVSSAGHVFRTKSLRDEPPWARNRAWVGGVGMGLLLVAGYLIVTLDRGIMAALPWYYFVASLTAPFLCLGINEGVKRKDRGHDDRAVRLRRLQFETRLGMWSPK